MKNTTLLFKSIILSCFAAASCTSSSVLDEPSMESDVPIAFGSKVLTRSVVDAMKNGMESFSVWGWYQPSTQVSGPFTNVFNATEVQPNGSYAEPRFWVEGQTYDFYAWHPAHLTQPSSGGTAPTSPIATSVTCTEQGTMGVVGFDASLRRGSDAVDLMRAQMKGLSYAAGTNPRPVSLKFSHELSWVEFKIAADQPIRVHFARLLKVGYKGDFTTSSSSVVPDSWNLTAYTDTIKGEPLNQTSFQVTDADVKAKKWFCLMGGGDLSNGNLLLPPQKLDQCVFMMKWSYTGMPDEFRVVRVPLPQAGVAMWEKGKHYVYSAVIPPTPAEVTLNVSVKPWKEKRLEVEL